MHKACAAFAMAVLLATIPAAAESDDAPAIPHFTASQRCPGDGSPEMKYDCDFLHEEGAADLEAPPGARVYRETWAGPFMAPMNGGSITLTIAADGSRSLKTPWRRRPYRLKPGDIPDFESLLARSSFAQRSVYNRIDAMCVDGVVTSVEAIVDGQYRLVLFDSCAGVFDENIALALDQLFVFAAGLSGLKYPVYPDHPTFRG